MQAVQVVAEVEHAEHLAVELSHGEQAEFVEVAVPLQYPVMQTHLPLLNTLKSTVSLHTKHVVPVVSQFQQSYFVQFPQFQYNALVVLAYVRAGHKS